MSIPYQDWQFWAVSAAALIAGLWLFRALLPFKPLKRKRRTRRATLTVDGKPVSR